MTTDLATDHTEAVRLFFEGDRSVDRLGLLAETCVWWNGLGRLPGAEGRTEFAGRDEIGEFLLARGGHHRLSTGEVVDRYDLATARFDDVVTIADGDYVFRQHTYRAKTVGGRDYENAYGFLFHFDRDGLIDRIWEHWGTLTAWNTLFTTPGPRLSNDELLTTTRAVRKRLDLGRPVGREVVEQCIELALQAPNGSNTQPWRWVVVDDPEKRAALADVYRGAMDDYVQRPRTGAHRGDRVDYSSPAAQRISASVYYLREHLDEVPVLVVPVVAGRTDGGSIFDQASVWGSILPAVWSFMLALRARGLGSAWTTLHLHREREAAELLGIPFDTHMQAGLFPVAYTLGDEFAPAPRAPVSEVVAWNSWAGDGNREA
jgi:nitroreductase